MEQLLRGTPREQLHLSEFALYSLGIVLLRRRQHNAFLRAVDDLFVTGDIQLLRLEAVDMPKVVRAAQQFNLDFDDAYQYALADKFSLTIVSFDSDFDRTERHRRTPRDVLAV